jgi:hypothetical protein
VSGEATFFPDGLPLCSPIADPVGCGATPPSELGLREAVFFFLVFLGCGGAMNQIYFLFVASSSSSPLLGSPLLRLLLRGEISSQCTFFLFWMMLEFWFNGSWCCLSGLNALFIDLGFRVCLEMFLLLLLPYWFMLSIYLLVCSMMMMLCASWDLGLNG